jgi:protein-tyrosine-phosphatase
MATKKSIPVDEKFEAQDFNLFDALLAMDKKDYEYYDRLTEEQQKKFIPYMMTHWMSAIKGSGDVQGYYLRSVDYHANKYLFNEYVQKHPKLQWYMLCASSPGLGKQFHQWIPHLGSKVTSLKEPAKTKEIKEYYTKIYPKVDSDDIDEIAKAFVLEHKRKCYLAETYPNLKQADIEVLSQLVTEEEIKQYEKDRGN